MLKPGFSQRTNFLFYFGFRKVEIANKRSLLLLFYNNCFNMYKSEKKIVEHLRGYRKAKKFFSNNFTIGHWLKI